MLSKKGEKRNAFEELIDDSKKRYEKEKKKTNKKDDIDNFKA